MGKCHSETYQFIFILLVKSMCQKNCPKKILLIKMFVQNFNLSKIWNSCSILNELYPKIQIPPAQSQFFWPQIFWTQIFYCTIFFCSKFFHQNYFWHNSFSDQFFLTKIFWLKNIFGITFLFNKDLWTKNFLEPKILLDPKLFWKIKFFWHKFFSEKLSSDQNFFGLSISPPIFLDQNCF